MAAIGYWFGRLFAVATAVIGVLVVAASVLDQHRLIARRATY